MSEENGIACNTSSNNLRSKLSRYNYFKREELSFRVTKGALCMSEENGIACKRRDQRSFETIDTSHRESMVLSPPPESTGTIAERSFETIDTFATSNCV